MLENPTKFEKSTKLVKIKTRSKNFLENNH